MAESDSWRVATGRKRLKIEEAEGNMAAQNTGTRDEIYNVISILYHALQGAETYQQYVQDAEQRNDQELTQFFRDVQEEEKRRAERAKQLLAKRLGTR